MTCPLFIAFILQTLNLDLIRNRSHLDTTNNISDLVSLLLLQWLKLGCNQQDAYSVIHTTLRVSGIYITRS